jgi:serine protease Do
MFTTAGVPNEMEWIGMTVSPLEADGAAAQGIPQDSGLLIQDVEGIAGRAGVRSGDVLLAINSNRVRDMFDFSHIAGETSLSRGGVQLDVIRGGSRVPLFVFPPPGGTGATAQVAPGGNGQPSAFIDRRWLGIEAEPFTAAAASELGIPAGARGVLIDTVTMGSQAAEAGLRNNDLIVSINGQQVDSTMSLWAILAGLNTADRVEFGVFRNGRLTGVLMPDASGTLAGGFPGRMGGQGLGLGGTLICPSCGTTLTHQPGVPCYTVSCPSCGKQMIRAQ